jgi:putative pyoverdin transport system ATP-binding/permease protein
MKIVPFKLIATLLRNSRRMILMAVLVGVLAGITSVALMALINAKVAQPQALSVKIIWAFAGLAFVDLLANFAAGLLATRIAHDNSFQLRMDLCRQILAAPLRRLEEAGPHRVLAALTQDVANLTQAYIRLPPLFLNLAIAIGCLVYLSWLSKAMFIALLIFLAVSVASWMLPERKAKRFLGVAREQWATLVDHFRSMTEGGKELKLHRQRRAAFLSQHLLASARAFRDDSVKAGSIYAMVNSWSQVLYFVVIGVMLFAFPSLIGGVSQMVLTGFALTVLYLRGPMVNLMNIIPYFSAAQVSHKAIADLGLTLTGTGVEEPEAPLHFDPNPLWRSLGLQQVTHKYYREKENGNFSLGPIDLTFQRGELVFIVGGNGSGKTTLIKLLTGLYAPEKGTISVDDQNITDETRESYRQYFTAVFADFYLFPELLGLTDPNLDERARAYISQLELDTKVELHDHKLSTTELSFGQRKRLALLTAFLEDRQIYVFDEWSAGQDPYFKEVFYYQILPELKARDKTVIVVSHDDRYYHVADRIIKLENGQVEYDKPVDADLLAVMSTPKFLPSYAPTALNTFVEEP